MERETVADLAVVALSACSLARTGAADDCLMRDRAGVEAGPVPEVRCSPPRTCSTRSKTGTSDGASPSSPSATGTQAAVLAYETGLVRPGEG